MGVWLLGGVSALWLGILTSISPCPLATNVAAISYVGRHISNPRRVLLAGLLYALGRSLAYLALGVLLVGSLLSVPHVSQFLQEYVNKLIGPVMVLVGMFLLGLLRIDLPGLDFGATVQRSVAGWGVWGAGALGVVFALSFCPVSAALFFGSLVPLAIKEGSIVLFPSLYGVGTAVPVLVFAVLLSVGTRSVAKTFDALTRVERWARQLTGGLFIAVGVYYTLVHIFGLFS